MGDCTFTEAAAAGQTTTSGPRELSHRISSWFVRHPFLADIDTSHRDRGLTETNPSTGPQGRTNDAVRPQDLAVHLRGGVHGMGVRVGAAETDRWLANFTAQLAGDDPTTIEPATELLLATSPTTATALTDRSCVSRRSWTT